MNVRTAAVWALVALLVAAGLLVTKRPTPVRAAMGAGVSAPVTWRQQVAPLVYARCTGCHHTGGSGPFDLTTYTAAKRWGPQIADVVASRYMPPWLPAESVGPKPVQLQGDRHLREDEIDLLTAWVKAGMPEGTGPAPAPPVYHAGWELGPPDLILEMPAAVTEPASGSDLFVNFIVPATVTGTRWVRAMEIQPGVGQLVHHANLIVDRTASLRAAHPADWQRGVPGMDLQIDAGDTFDPDSHFLFWKPDSTALVEPPGMPWRLDPGNDLILNMHLKPTGKPEAVRARIGLYFTPQPATAHPMLLQLEADSAVRIPAGDPNFVVTDELRLPVAVDVLGLYPHAHYLCRRMEAWATLPDGEKQPLILIKDWDIDRQSVYRLTAPLRLPAGSVLHMRYVYDNSAANVHNPHSPPVAVHAGNRATDEMSHFWLQVLPLPDGPPLPHGSKNTRDPRYALEGAWMEHVLQRSPTDPIALYNLGALRQMEGRPREAAAYFRQLLAAKPGEPRALTSLGSALEAAGDEAGARAEFEAALQVDPRNLDAAFDLARLSLRAGQNVEAEARFRKVLAVHPEDTEAADGLGEALLAQGRAAEAETILKRALDHDSASAATHRLLAMVYAGTGNSAETLAELRAWVRLQPGEADAHRALAQVLSAAGQMNEGLREQWEVLRLAGDSAGDWNDLGSMEARAGRWTEAQAAFEHALRLEPANAAAQANLRRLKASASAK